MSRNRTPNVRIRSNDGGFAYIDNPTVRAYNDGKPLGTRNQFGATTGPGMTREGYEDWIATRARQQQNNNVNQQDRAMQGQQTGSMTSPTAPISPVQQRRQARSAELAAQNQAMLNQQARVQAQRTKADALAPRAIKGTGMMTTGKTLTQSSPKIVGNALAATGTKAILGTAASFMPGLDLGKVGSTIGTTAATTAKSKGLIGTPEMKKRAGDEGRGLINGQETSEAISASQTATTQGLAKQQQNALSPILREIERLGKTADTDMNRAQSDATSADPGARAHASTLARSAGRAEGRIQNLATMDQIERGETAHQAKMASLKAQPSQPPAIAPRQPTMPTAPKPAAPQIATAPTPYRGDKRLIY